MKRLTILALLILCMGAAEDDNYTLPAADDDLNISATWHVPATANDRQYGPTQINTNQLKTAYACPYIPYTFGTDAYQTANPDLVIEAGQSQAATIADFDAALAAVQPGEAIIFKDGSYPFTMGQNSSSTIEPFVKIINIPDGTAQDRIYILSENLHGADNTSNIWHWLVQADYITIAGFAGYHYYDINGNNFRVACGDYDAYNLQDSSMEMLNTRFNSAYFEFDNNVVYRYVAGPKTQMQDNRSPGNWDNLGPINIHHNRFEDSTPTGTDNDCCEALSPGIGNWAGIPEETTIYSPTEFEGTQMDTYIKNNLFVNWTDDSEIITVKASKMEVANNCFVTSRGHMSIRLGQGIQYHGNWHIGSGYGHTRVGPYSQIAFNYFHDYQANGGLFFLNRSYQRWSIYSPPAYVYYGFDDAVVRYNVGSGFGTGAEWVQNVGQTTNTEFMRNSSGAVYSDNVAYTTNTLQDYVDVGGYFNESAFKAANVFSNNTRVAQNLSPTLTEAGCFDETLFDGPGTEGVTFIPGDATLLNTSDIYPPSWWD